MAIRNVGRGGNESDGFSSIDQRLSGLSAAVGDKMDELDEDGEGGSSAVGGDKKDAPAEPEPVDDEDDADDDEDDSSEPEPFRIPKKADDADSESPTDDADPAKAKSDPAQEPTSNAVDPAVKVMISRLRGNTLDTFKKYAKDLNEIKTVEQFTEIMELVSTNYIDSSNRLSKLAKEGKEPTPEPAKDEKKEEASRPELQRYDMEIHSLRLQGTKAQTERDAYTKQIDETQRSMRRLELRAKTGDAKAAEELDHLKAELDDLKDQRDGWNERFESLRSKHDDYMLRKQEAARVLEVADKLQRKEKEDAEVKEREPEQAFVRAFQESATGSIRGAISKELIEKHGQAAFEFVHDQTVGHIQRGNRFTSREALDAYVTQQVQRYMRAEGIPSAQKAKPVMDAEEYARKKVADAPKPPVRKGNEKKRKKLRPASERPNLRHLESEVFGSEI